MDRSAGVSERLSARETYRSLSLSIHIMSDAQSNSGAIRPKNSRQNGCILTPNWRQKLTPLIQFETILILLHYEEKEGGGISLLSH